MARMQAIAELVHDYIRPDPVNTRGAWRSGKAAISPRPGGWTALVFDDYLKPGDRLAIELDPVAGKIRLVTVSTYTGKAGDIVTFTTRYDDLADGTNHARQSEAVAMKQRVRVTITNAQFTRLSS